MIPLLEWFAGDGQYHNLYHCLGYDAPWVAITVLLDLAVVMGYSLIAYHWNQQQKHLPEGMPGKTSLATLRNIFVFCGICGYLFIPIKMVWPAWRLYDIFLVPLVCVTWRYAWGARELKVIYQRMERADHADEMAHAIDDVSAALDRDDLTYARAVLREVKAQDHRLREALRLGTHPAR